VVNDFTGKAPKTMKLSSPFKVALMLTVCVLLFSFAAQAQTVRANVPFSFLAGDRVLPAGEYKLAIDARTGIIQFQPSADAGFYIASHCYTSRESAADRGALVFHRYGDTYFLKRVLTAASREGRELYPARGERDAARRHGAFEVAMIPTFTN
jgi:hypothetical protein